MSFFNNNKLVLSSTLLLGIYSLCPFKYFTFITGLGITAFTINTYKVEICYNILRYYTLYFNNQTIEKNDLEIKGNIEMGIEYLEYDFENLKLVKTSKINPNVFSMTLLKFNNHEFIGFNETNEYNTINVNKYFISIFNERMKKNPNQELINEPINLINKNNTFLSVTCDIILNDEIYQTDIDITQLINKFCFNENILILDSSHILPMFDLINNKCNLNIDLTKYIDVDNIKRLNYNIPKSILNISYTLIDNNVETFTTDDTNIILDKIGNINLNKVGNKSNIKSTDL